MTNFRETVHRIFLPQLDQLAREGALRETYPHTSPYQDSLDPLVVAASLVGTAQHLGLEYRVIGSESPHEFALRKKLRGKTDQTMLNEVAHLSTDEVYEELGSAVSRYDVQQMASLFQKMCDDGDDTPSLLGPKDGESIRVSRIDTLFTLAETSPRSVTYCRIHIANGTSRYSAIGWNSPESHEEPAFDHDLLFDFESLCERESLTIYLSGVAQTCLFVKHGKYNRNDVRKVVDSILARK